MIASVSDCRISRSVDFYMTPFVLRYVAIVEHLTCDNCVMLDLLMVDVTRLLLV